MDEMQVKGLTEMWKGTGLLNGIKSEYEQQQMAVLLDNQRRDNEEHSQHRTECMDPAARGKYPQFLRCSIPIVRRVFNSNAFLGFKIASVQAVTTVEATYFYRDMYGVLKPKSIACRTRPLRERVSLEPRDLEFNLDAEAEECARLSESIAGELSWEVVRDMVLNARIKNVAEWKGADALVSCIGLVASQVFRRTNKEPNWIVVHSGLADALMGKPEQKQPAIAYRGTLAEKYRVYSVDRMEPNEVLLGHKGDDYTAGYFYCPMTPVFWMPGTGEDMPEGGYPYMTTYGKAMPFPDFYGHVTLTGYDTNKENDDGVRDNVPLQA